MPPFVSWDKAMRNQIDLVSSKLSPKIDLGALKVSKIRKIFFEKLCRMILRLSMATNINLAASFDVIKVSGVVLAKGSGGPRKC